LSNLLGVKAPTLQPKPSLAINKVRLQAPNKVNFGSESLGSSRRHATNKKRQLEDDKMIKVYDNLRIEGGTVDMTNHGQLKMVNHAYRPYDTMPVVKWD
jgi:hypothetical protein